MAVSSIVQGLRRYISELRKLSKKAEVSFAFLLFDCLYSRLRYGCVLNQYVVGNFYKRKGFERKDILTYHKWCKIIARYNSSNESEIYKDKCKFNCEFSDYIHRDWLYSATMTIEDFRQFAHLHKEAIVKPFNGSEGDGIEAISLNDLDDITFKELYEKLKEKQYIIEERIYQHNELVFNNKSVNTIRCYTCVGSKSLNPSIVKTVIRVGIGDSLVDNSHSGGCAYEVDLETGFIVSQSYCANGFSSFIHPGTSICMLGKQIPFWEQVKQMCLNAAKRRTGCKFIGWDVAITEIGPLLIEGNHTPDLDMIEFVGRFGHYKEIINKLNN